MQNNLYDNFVNDFSKVMCDLADNRQYSNIIFLCIGTDRITGDSFGPLVGYKLNSYFEDADRINIMGDLSNPVTSNNIISISNQIRENYTNPFIVAVDSALDNAQNIGNIIVSEGPLSLGTSIKRTYIDVGHMNIKGIVAENTSSATNNFCVLQNTSLNLVMNLANVVSRGIYNTINYEVDV